MGPGHVVARLTCTNADADYLVRHPDALPVLLVLASASAQFGSHVLSLAAAAAAAAYRCSGSMLDRWVAGRIRPS